MEVDTLKVTVDSEFSLRFTAEEENLAELLMAAGEQIRQHPEMGVNGGSLLKGSDGRVRFVVNCVTRDRQAAE